MKRIAELRDLSDDHHTALVLARRCLRARPGDDSAIASAWAAVRAAFDVELEPHFRIEEQYLLPALEEIGESELAERVRSDHALLRGLVAAGAADAGHVERFGHLLDAHVRFEEREVFELAQTRLSPTALAAIAAACSQWRRARAKGGG
ncbi:hypothetical protein MYXO_01182 [Myxococcaceae bacterium]|nr:hypothetical protein MYXO_01182 [Myxococcaceae bacterium]